MKKRLLEFLACPRCKCSLRLTQGSGKEEVEVTEGLLQCRGCEAQYPISGSVPRFTGAQTYAHTFAQEWRWFRRVQLDPFTRDGASERIFAEKTGLQAEDVRGRVVVDAGTGAGRFAEVVSRWGGEVIAFDVTGAVDVAQANLGSRERVHLVQCDIFNPPFRPQCADLVFSIGVLHHTPDAERAFRCLTSVVRDGGLLVVNVYSAYFPEELIRLERAVRSLTTRLPLGLLWTLSFLAVPFGWLSWLPFVRIVSPFRAGKDWRERWLDTFDRYTPKFQSRHSYPEVYSWFGKAGLHEIELLPARVSVRGRRPTQIQATLPPR